MTDEVIGSAQPLTHVEPETAAIIATLRNLAHRAEEALDGDGRLSNREALARVEAFHKWCTPVIILHLIKHYEECRL